MLCSSSGDSLPLFSGTSSCCEMSTGLSCLVHAHECSWVWVAPVTVWVGQIICVNCGSQSKALAPYR